MDIFFRVDANSEIGMGHLMRCLTLAKTFKSHSHNVTFAFHNINEKAHKLIKSDFLFLSINSVESLDFLEKRENSATLVIVDHYQINHSWHKNVISKGATLVVIDDLIEKEITAHYVLNQNLTASIEAYKKKNCQVYNRYLLGPQYALIRDEFINVLHTKNKEYGLLISMGGADGKNQTPRMLNILDKLNYKEKVLVIVGPTAKNLEEIQNLKSRLNIQVDIKINSKEIAEDMKRSKLSIGAGGISNYERICLNLPTFVITTAENQVLQTEELEKRKLIHYVGHWNQVDDSQLKESLQKFLCSPPPLSDKIDPLIDGQGVKRAYQELTSSMM
ncbi:MAG: UDP-2,4-diacetamido-2,4,6-trideoxy-beta-L-altropyranose hydrolase [Bdellovibrionota bacterium]|nr:UDP-2,4-diacetamido-2,4,6-trideoxy-beta-L-altropyranose hydrolase [Bdellovibrionota bacterium]